MNLSTHIHRGFVALALCAAVSAYAATHTVSSTSAIPVLGTITVTAPSEESDDSVVYSEVQGKARVTVGAPITLGPKQALPQIAMR